MNHELIDAIDAAEKVARESLLDCREKSLVITKLQEARLWAQEVLRPVLVESAAGQ